MFPLIGGISVYNNDDSNGSWERKGSCVGESVGGGKEKIPGWRGLKYITYLYEASKWSPLSTVWKEEEGERWREHKRGRELCSTYTVGVYEIVTMKFPILLMIPKN